jgi:hypothetical protein
MRVSRKSGEGDDKDRVETGRGKMRVSRKRGEGDEEDRVGRGKMRVSWMGGEGMMKIGKGGGR